MSKKIKVAIAGVGSCASALIQGIAWYAQNKNNTVGLSYPDIGGYTAKDIEFVIGFDVDARKVGKDLADAIYSQPNCNMEIISQMSDGLGFTVNEDAQVYRGPTLDGIAEHMRTLPVNITFVEDVNHVPLDIKSYKEKLIMHDVDILLNYMPVGSEAASKFYIESAMAIGVHVVNCMPSYISTDDAKRLEQIAIDNSSTIVGSDMRSAYGASRLSEVLQGSMLDSGLIVTTHVQENKALGCTQGQEHIMNGVTANTDFLNMMNKDRLINKHISKENVLKGQNVVRNLTTDGHTMYAGPSLTVQQRAGGVYRASDNKIANIDMVAFGWGGARYELQARLSVQDSPNSAGIVFDAIRFCKVAEEEGVVGYLRGVSAHSQKTPPVQMTTSDAKFECDALSRRIITPIVEKQLSKNNPKVEDLEYTFQTDTTDY